MKNIYRATAVLELERFARDLMETQYRLISMTVEPGSPGLNEKERRRVQIACGKVSDACMSLASLVNDLSVEVLCGEGDGPRVLVSGPGVLVVRYKCPDCGVTGDAIMRGKALSGEERKPMCLACMEVE